MSATIGSDGRVGPWRRQPFVAAASSTPFWPRWRLAATLTALFAMPVALSIVGLAPVAKLGYPAGIACVAFWLGRRDPAAFLALLLWTIILTPGLRHFVDWYAGFSQTNPMMLAPLLAALAAAPAVGLHLVAGRRFAAAGWILLLSITSGLAVPILTGALEDALLEAVRWLAPVLLAVFIWANADALPAMRESVCRTFGLALPAVAVYGIVQFVAILPWDAYYMAEAPIKSIGSPAPFLVRVFATMNSPGSLAAMLATGTLLVLPRIRGWGWLSVLLALAVLILTSQRAALGAFVLAFAVLAATNRDRALRASALKLAVVSSLAVAALLAIPGADEKVLATYESVGQLEYDNSAQQRLEQYKNFPGMLEEQLYGLGLAWNSNPFYIRVGDSVPADSGFIDIFVSLGVPGGLLYLTGLGALVLQGCLVASREVRSRAPAELAAVVFGVVQLPFGGQHTSEHGMLLYVALGLLLSRTMTEDRLLPTNASAPGYRHN